MVTSRFMHLFYLKLNVLYAYKSKTRKLVGKEKKMKKERRDAIKNGIINAVFNNEPEMDYSIEKGEDNKDAVAAVLETATYYLIKEIAIPAGKYVVKEIIMPQGKKIIDDKVKPFVEKKVEEITKDNRAHIGSNEKLEISREDIIDMEYSFCAPRYTQTVQTK